MYFPFKIIESKMTSRKQFDVVDGYHKTYALLYLKEGRFTIEIDGCKEEVFSGDCVILPDYVHFKRNVIDPIVFVYVKFEKDINCPFSFEPPCGKIKWTDKSRFLSDISEMERTIDYDDAFSVSYREHLLIDILFQIYSDQHPGEPLAKIKSPRDPLVASAMDYITQNIDKKLGISDVCLAVGTNPSTLNFKFHREFNRSIGQLIIDERMKIARHLLISTTYPLSKIALRCGFENIYYFSNTFKKHHSLSPLSYRKQKLML